MKKIYFYALCMSVTFLCMPLVSCGDDEEEELTEILGGESGDDNNNQGTGGDGNNTSSGLNGHEAVDLGLSVRWATCNVGASSPEEYGGYYAWGETEEKEVYDWSTYKYCNGSSSTMTKYCTKSSYGTVDNKIVLELDDDVAHVKWGGSWRMPTLAEITELINKCTWTWTAQNGINGYVVTSKSNGNNIFLPAAGSRSGEDIDYSGRYGHYWSVSLIEDCSFDVYSLYFYESDEKWFRTNYVRSRGFSVRPVTE